MNEESYPTRGPERCRRHVRYCQKSYLNQLLGQYVEGPALDAGPHVSGVERGVRNPTLTVIERLAGALGVTLADLGAFN